MVVTSATLEQQYRNAGSSTLGPAAMSAPGPKRTYRPKLLRSALGRGCVKTPDAAVGTQQWKRRRSHGVSFAVGEASGLNQSCAQMTRRKVFTQPRPKADTHPHAIIDTRWLGNAMPKRAFRGVRHNHRLACPHNLACDGSPVRSCLMFGVQADGCQIRRLRPISGLTGGRP